MGATQGGPPRGNVLYWRCFLWGGRKAVLCPMLRSVVLIIMNIVMRDLNISVIIIMRIELSGCVIRKSGITESVLNYWLIKDAITICFVIVGGTHNFTCFADVAFCGHGVRTRQIWGQADGYPLTVINRSWRGRRKPLFAPFTGRSVSEPPFS